MGLCLPREGLLVASVQTVWPPSLYVLGEAWENLLVKTKIKKALCILDLTVSIVLNHLPIQFPSYVFLV